MSMLDRWAMDEKMFPGKMFFVDSPDFPGFSGFSGKSFEKAVFRRPRERLKLFSRGLEVELGKLF